MRSWVARAVLPIAGAVFGAEVVGVLEALRMGGESQVPLLAVASGDAAVVVPVATLVGAIVAALLFVLDPARAWRARAAASALRGLGADARARWAAAALVTPPAMLLWGLVCAHAARSALATGAPLAVGVDMAAAALAALVFVAAGVVATVPVTARTVTAGVGPLLAGSCGVSFALAGLAVGVRLGDASGRGPTPLAILGVLARRELDLWPVVAVLLIVACAIAGERISSILGGAPASRLGWRDPVVVAFVVVALAWGLVVRQAYALSDAPRVARAIEAGAPLGRIGLALARAATDHDGDGASALFGGGDCDDDDPRRSPTAFDIPGNGIDEDCSGADMPLPPAPLPPPAPPPRPAPRPDLNLVLITVDTLRIDLGFMGYDRPVSPHLDALAARSTVFERAYSMASYTGKSVGPTLIGKYPSECIRDSGHFNVYGKANTLLAERLQAAGFHTMGAAAHWYFKAKYGLAQGMDLWDMSALRSDSEQDSDTSVTSEALTDVALGMLGDRANVDRRFFMWLHYFDPHAPYVPHPEAPDFRAHAKSWSKPLYDGEVWYTDHHIGRLLDFIDSQPWGARTVIILTADHGEAFDEHGMNWHGGDVWEPIVRVPLVVYVPGARPHRVSVKRSLIDLVPTVLDLLGVPQPPPGELSGESDAADIVGGEDAGPPPERDIFMDVPWGPRVSQHRALIHGPSPGFKLMHEGGAQYMVFDLSRDPGELNDLSRSRAILEPLVEAYQEKVASLREVKPDPSL